MQGKLACLTGNHLKLIAAFTMLLDHMGVLLFPDILLFRFIGRLSYPLFAFMIAEGCRYTRNKARYFFLIFGLGTAYQLVYDLVGDVIHLNILLTFSFSILLIYLLQAAHQAQSMKKKVLWWSVFVILVLSAYGLDQIIIIDYGFLGVMLPVLVAFAHIRKFPHWAVVLVLGIGLVLMCMIYEAFQRYCLLVLPLLLLYSGKRGKANLKYFFYIFYPVHLAVLQGVAMLMN